VVQATSYLAGEATTTPEDLLVLTHALWREPKEYSKVAHIVGQLADPVSAKAAEVLDAARETAARVAAMRSSDRKSYLSQAAQALEEFKAQQEKLKDLVRGAGPRAKQALGDADQEIGQLHYDLARAVSAGLGLGGVR
jgi:MoxR-like ATPase